MKIVIDTSVIIAVITNEIHKQSLLKITEDAELIAPSSLHWEVGNAFSAMIKRNRIDLDRAKAALRAYKKIPIQFYDVQLESALLFAADLDLYAYDAYFLVCAKTFNLPLLSLDKPLIKMAVKEGIKTLEVEK